jgi:hypothetical protein
MEEKEKVFWSHISLLYFFIIAFIGTVIRSSFLTGEFPFEYKHLLHAHSHIGFLGWIYPILFMLIITSFLDKEKEFKGGYETQLMITNTIVYFLLSFFLFEGYSTITIILSSIFQLMTYWFTYRILKDTKEKNSYDTKFLKMSVGLLAFSSLGTWLLPVSKVFKIEELYNLCIYFYLHFQYNGWFTFAIISLILNLLKRRDFYIENRTEKLSYYFMAFSIIPSYFLSTIGQMPNKYVYIISTIGSVTQFTGITLFLRLVVANFGMFIKGSKITFSLLFISCLSLFTKAILQVLSGLPSFTEMIFESRDFILSYLHLTFIGFISASLFFLLIENGWFKLNKIINIALTTLFIGFIGTEGVLTLSGLGNYMDSFNDLMFIFSLIMLIGIGTSFASQLPLISKK